MRDPLEHRARNGHIITGADHRRIPDTFRTVVDDAVARITHERPDIAVFLYGSAATGQAVIGTSDIDTLTIGLGPEQAQHIAHELSARHALTCRSVQIGAARPSDFVGEGDEAYGNRVFLRHYCVHMAGPRSTVPTQEFPADVRAARSFNGDIAQHLAAWHRTAELGEVPQVLARQVARKTLLAVAGLVSVADRIWTTDRTTAARRWSTIEPHSSDAMATLLVWSELHGATPTSDAVNAMLDTSVADIVDRFDADIGLWENSSNADRPSKVR